MRIRPRVKGILEDWPLPTGNRIRVWLKTIGGKQEIQTQYQHPPTDEEQQMRQHVLRLAKPKEAYVVARLYARAQQHNQRRKDRM